MTEAWLRGPIDGVPPYLMPAAHAIVQAVEDIDAAVDGLTPAQVWARPGNAASIGFHLRHIAGVLDRLLTYARGEQLSEHQLGTLKYESDPGNAPPAADALVALVRAAVDRALTQMRATAPDSLLDAREVGRQRLPSTVMGLVFHAAEHTQRHTGGIVATAKVVRAGDA